MKADKVAFLINPVSGNRKSRKQCHELTEFLATDFRGTVFQPSGSDEMREIVRDLAAKNYRAIVACGGDGTINLVSGEILGTDTALAVIPLGSGNGFARHHHIPLKWNKALEVLANPVESIRDTGVINGIHFVNIAGVGFAARISHLFKNSTRRGLSGYAGTVLKHLRMEPFQAAVSNELSSWQGETWMVEFCNGSQWGNNFRLEPAARDDDGALNAVIFKKMHPAEIPAIGFRFATNSVPESSNVYSFTGAVFSMEFEGQKPLHVDGEAVAIVENYAEIKVVPSSLKIWTF